MTKQRSIKFEHVLAAALIGSALSAAPARGTPYAQINAAAADDPVKAAKLRGDLSMLSGSGGNIGVLKSKNGLLLVDAGIAVSQKKIEAALRKVGPGPVRYVIDTHWHWDHTDGNGWLRRSGAIVMADPHVIRRLKQTIRVVEWEHTFTPLPSSILPNRPVGTDQTMRFGGEVVRLHHYRPSHTDGDLSAYFVHANVLATGDTFWNGYYPFIDYVTGGSIDGAIAAANANLAKANARTQIIPGHGPVGNRVQLVAFRDMLVEVRHKVAALKAKGMSIEQVVAAKPTAALDAKWGGGVISGELFTRLVYRGV